MKNSASKNRPRPRRNRLERKRLVKLWRESAEPKADFCLAHNISEDSFGRWQLETERESAISHGEMPSGGAHSRAGAGERFVEVRLDKTDSIGGPQPHRQPEIVLRGAGGTCVELYGSVARSMAERIVAMLQEGSSC